jgi:hypothetical protein
MTLKWRMQHSTHSLRRAKPVKPHSAHGLPLTNARLPVSDICRHRAICFHSAPTSHTETVRKIFSAFVLAYAGWCQAQTPSPAVLDVSPRIGLIEVFGARKAPLPKILAALIARPGDPLPASEAAEDRINKVSGVAASRLEAVCCANGGRMILYVGIEERDAPRLEFHPAPTGDVRLPSDLYQDYLSLLESVEGSIRGRNADEDLTNGYSLMADPDARVVQQRFIPLAETNLKVLDEVVRESSDPEQRAAAAYLLQYGPRGRASKIIADALQYAVRDQEDIVRNNAMHALRAVTVGAKLHPEQNMAIEPTWFVEMLNSVVWSDRRSAAQELVELTEDRKPQTLELIRERALPAIVEMSRWHTLDHALPAFILAGRIAGFDEKEIKDAWLREDRESILNELSGKKAKRRK